MRPLCLLALCLCSIPGLLNAAERLNVLFIAVDDLRPMLGCYGDPVAQTPNIDALASQGTLFERAYTQVAICSPSRISLLSGRYPTETQIFTIGPHLRSTLPDAVTLPQYFKQNGYFTQSLGKIYHSHDLDDPDSWSVPSWNSPLPHSGPQGSDAIHRAEDELVEKDIDISELKYRDRPYYQQDPFERAEVADNELKDGGIAAYAEQRLQELAQEPNQPFFLAVGFFRPHLPWVCPAKYWELYDKADIQLPDNQSHPLGAPVYAYAPVGELEMFRGTPTPHFQYTDSFKRQCLQGYLACTSYIDSLIGGLMETLRETGLDKNTIVVLWGDHGYHLGEQGLLGCKHTNYEVATRVPLIIVTPDTHGKGRQTDALAELVDLAPTLVDLCGLPPSPEFAGTSLKPVLEGTLPSVNDAAYSWFIKYSSKGPRMGNAVRTDRYRFVEWVDKLGQTDAIELYDMQGDPEQTQNIADDPQNQQLISEIKNRLNGSQMRLTP